MPLEVLRNVTSSCVRSRVEKEKLVSGTSSPVNFELFKGEVTVSHVRMWFWKDKW